MICIDSSVAAKWVLMEDHSEQAFTLYYTAIRTGEDVIAPILLPIELTNILRQQVRRGILTAADATRMLEYVLGLHVTLLTPTQSHRRALEMANQFDLPAAYDAYYLVLAQELGATLWTADQRLLHAVGDRLPFVRSIADYIPT